MSADTNAPAQLLPWRDFIPADEGMSRWYMSYAVSTLMMRAIPDVRDGLKPVHRRILYAMHQLNLGPKGPHKKAARVVGDVIGKYHPHGDASVYEAMVLLSQNFNMRHPLVDGQGNWGSIDGDPAAAMRYTECRLTDIAQLLLSELEMGTVDFRPNYDGNDSEPVSMPSRVPTILMNDQMGIAVGMASDIPGHNLAEVCAAAGALLQNSDATLPDLLKHIPGPDFATGGQVITPRSEIEEIYRTGRGMLTVRCRWEVKKDHDGWRIVVFELPPKISPDKVLGEFEELSNPTPKKGKKPGDNQLSPEQKAAKAEMLGRVSAVNNSAGQGTPPVQIEICPKSRRQDPHELMGYLCSVTSLESRVKVNQCVVSLDGFPRQMGLLEILRDWCAYRTDTVIRRTKSRLEKVDARIHILEGFAKILLDIDEVIRMIRASDSDVEAKQRLMNRWTLSEIQADKVLDMRLRQLTRLDSIAIDKELGTLRDERKDLAKMLADRKTLLKRIGAELAADAAKFGSPRRTVIEEAAPAVFEETVSDDPVTIVLSQKGWLRSRQGHGLEVSGMGFKDGDGLHTTLETSTANSIVLMDSQGRAYTISAGAVPGGRGDGVPVASLIDLYPGARIIAAFLAHEKDRVLLSSTIGYGFVTEIGNLTGRVKAGKAIVTVKDGEMLPPVLLGPKEDRVFAASSAGNALVFPLAEVLEYPKGQGCKLIALKPGEEMLRLVAYSKEVMLPAVRGNGVTMTRAQLEEEYIRTRGARGRLLPKNVAVNRL
ncbi:MAG TPA: DNA topoisomerase IV subunit A [Candidatus Deferrimicrobiaceae bacterium]|jgi:topoisomerase-4 subunit A